MQGLSVLSLGADSGDIGDDADHAAVRAWFFEHVLIDFYYF